MTKARLAAALAAICSVYLAVGGPAGAPRPDATVAIFPGSAKPGTSIVVRLDGWAIGTVTVGVCGNNARRGSQDCALTGDEGVSVRGDGSTLLDLPIVVPPVPCPCVVRAATPAGDRVRTTPIEIIGVPIGPELVPTGGPPSRSQVRTSVRVVTEHTPWLSLFGGPAPRTLVVTVHNRGSEPVTNLRVVSAFGHDRSHGEPIAPVEIATLGAGQTRHLRIPFDLSAPAFGDYKVFGSIYGLAQPLRFSVDTSNDPWAIEVAAPLTLLLLAQLARRRERARRRAAEVAARTHAAAGPSKDLLPESSPPVGESDEERWHAHAYVPPRGGHSQDDGADHGRHRREPAAQPTAKG